MVHQMPHVNGSFRDVSAHKRKKTSVSCSPKDIRVIFRVARDRSMFIDDRAH
jgi:hypothetical protein